MIQLKGQDFLLPVFFINHLPRQAPENNIRVIPNFLKNSRRSSQVEVHHRYQRLLVANTRPTC
jgi:hypothetical protein